MRRWVNLVPGRGGAGLLGVLPLVLLVALYLVGAQLRHGANPNDKLLPTPAAMASAVQRLALERSPRSGRYEFWSDTSASVRRLALGVSISAAVALAGGVVLGALPYARATFAPMVGVLAMVPPMAVLPILFILFGLGELAKVVLIVFGIAPLMVRYIEMSVLALPAEQLIKAQTLGASSASLVLRVIVPQVLPRLVDAVRLSLGPAWLFLISAEAIAATEGLGYRIFLVRRYLAMDVILPYVLWITLLAFGTDLALRALSRRAFRWAQEAG